MKNNLAVTAFNWRGAVAGLLMAAAATFSLPSQAQDEPSSKDNPMLQKMLERFPEADANHDGILIMSEMKDYRAKTGTNGPAQAAAPGGPGGLEPAVPALVTGPAPTDANVSYGPDEKEILDFWKAPSDKPTPLVIFIHGGGFSAGDKKDVFRGEDVVTPRLKDGVSFASIDYPFVSKAVLPDIMRDCARALQFLRSKDKEWNIDKTRVAVYGGSAGAGASLWLAFHPDLADPHNVDPVLRESTRPVVVGAMATQSTYDIRQWETILGPFPGPFPERLRLGFFHFKSREDEETPEGKRMRADVDLLQLMSKDSAPFFAYTASKVEPAKVITAYIHSAGHAVALEKRAKEVGLECAVFVKGTPVPGGRTANQYMWKFFYDHLGIKNPPSPAVRAGQADH